MRKLLNDLALGVLVVVGMTRCTQVSFPKLFQLASETVSEVFAPATAREAYERSLRKAGIDRTDAGRAWLDAGERALTDSVSVGLPFRETGIFPAETPLAYGYRVTVPAGRRLVARVNVPKADSGVRVFVDLFELRGGKPKRLKAVEAGQTLAQDAGERSTFLVRVQPQLPETGFDLTHSFTVTLESQPVLTFPVEGKRYEDIVSFWGMPRDGGRRLHQGVDIAAPKGTPVLAAADGIVSQVTSDRLGGLVIYQTDTEHGLTLYYAHLSRQLAKPGQRVKRGQTIALVGNTGNAIHTGPHLHFGVVPFFQKPTDPLPFLDARGARPSLPATSLAVNQLGTYQRTVPTWAALRKSPDTRDGAAVSLPKNTVLRPVAVTSAKGWYRVALPNGTVGYLQAAQLQPVQRQLRKQALAVRQPLLTAPTAPADTLRVLAARQSVSVLGQFGSYDYVETADKQNGWVRVEK
jgi:murein DD-endopeptidase MepM/ murein hydrolase activator NlpD